MWLTKNLQGKDLSTVVKNFTEIFSLLQKLHLFYNILFCISDVFCHTDTFWSTTSWFPDDS